MRCFKEKSRYPITKSGNISTCDSNILKKNHNSQMTQMSIHGWMGKQGGVDIQWSIYPMKKVLTRNYDEGEPPTRDAISERS